MLGIKNSSVLILFILFASEPKFYNVDNIQSNILNFCDVPSRWVLREISAGIRDAVSPLLKLEDLHNLAYFIEHPLRDKTLYTSIEPTFIGMAVLASSVLGLLWDYNATFNMQVVHDLFFSKKLNFLISGMSLLLWGSYPMAGLRYAASLLLGIKVVVGTMNRDSECDYCDSNIINSFVMEVFANGMAAFCLGTTALLGVLSWSVMNDIANHITQQFKEYQINQKAVFASRLQKARGLEA